ncbi:MAG: glycosyltransferase, partial [Thermodesulfovibrionales bacterium]|nr:glycosyltransferase [Thermodesulfovibrionales bacterium]
SCGIDVAECDYQKNYIDVKVKYSITGDYIYYPAQFWSHKNHIYILEGLKVLKEKYNIKINAVFSGSDKGNLEFVLKRVEDFGLNDQIHYIGFVSNEEIPYLYKQSLALVMPTYFGPTNIPPLEAFKLGCPVLYPDLSDLKEQVKDSALLMDLADPESLALNLIKIIEKDKEIGNLVKNGKRKIEDLREEDYWLVFQGIFDDYARKLKCWKE